MTTAPAQAPPAYNAASFALHQRLAPVVRRIRMLGSAAADLAFVADGTLDASLTLSNRPWDVAAGTFIARQAGAAVLDLDGRPYTLASATTLDVAPGLRDGPLAAIRPQTCKEADR
ncbi:inositol monophosphatase family protein [Streptomyces anulatus]|uniref:inositol monophosphatase family protein n=1 Tax=Streptomyces anulatus TaxID=1892 RepID=UPI003420CA5E